MRGIKIIIFLTLSFSTYFIGLSKNDTQTKSKSTKVSPSYPAKKLIGLEQALSYAYNNSPAIKAIQQEYSANYNELLSRIIPSFLPSVRIRFLKNFSNSSRNVLNKNDLNTFDNRTVSEDREIVASQTLLSFKNIFEAKSIFNEIKSQQSRYHSNEQKFILEVVKAYSRVQAAKEIHIASKRALDNTKLLLEGAKRKYELGFFTLIETKSAESKYYESISEEASQYVEYIRALENANNYFVIRDEDLSWPSVDKILSFDEMKDKAINNNYSILENKYQLFSRDNMLSSRAASSFLPEIKLEFSDSLNNSSSSTYSSGNKASIVLDFNLFSGGKDLINLKSAKHNLNRARYAFADSKNKLSLDILNLFNNFQNFLLKVEVLDKALEASRLASSSIRNKQELGESSIIDYIQILNNEYGIEKALIRSKEDLVNTFYEILQIQGKATAKSLKVKGRIFNPEAFIEGLNLKVKKY